MSRIKSDINVMVTGEYCIFKSQVGNRELREGDIKKIEAKILENNMLKYHPIIVDKDMYVVDGQHRLEVAKRNSLDIYYIVMSENSSISITQKINTTGKKWLLSDFLQSYCSSGVKSYQLFKSIIEENDFLSIPQLITILGGGKAVSSLNIAFKEGGLLITKDDEEQAKALISRIKLYSLNGYDLSRFTHFQRFMNISMLRGKAFDDNRMITQMNKNIDVIKRLPGDCYKISEVLHDLYNHNMRKNYVSISLRNFK